MVGWSEYPLNPSSVCFLLFPSLFHSLHRVSQSAVISSSWPCLVAWCWRGPVSRRRCSQPVTASHDRPADIRHGSSSASEERTKERKKKHTAYLSGQRCRYPTFLLILRMEEEENRIQSVAGRRGEMRHCSGEGRGWKQSTSCVYCTM